MKTKAELICDINEFLSTVNDGESDLAPVSKQDLVQLDQIIYSLLQLKFKEDCDGDLPVECLILNRHTHMRPLPTQVVRESGNRKNRQLIQLMNWACNLLDHECMLLEERISFDDVEVSMLTYRSGGLSQNPNRVQVKLDFEKRSHARLYHALKDQKGQ